MKTLLLKKGLSYSAMGIKCVKGAPASVADDIAANLLATGCFEEVPIERQQSSEPDFENMKAEDLTRYADLHGIDLSGCRTNKDRVKKIREALENRKSDGNKENDMEEAYDPLREFVQHTASDSE